MAHWSRSAIRTAGNGIAPSSTRGNQIQAAINAVHADAATAGHTDRPQIVALPTDAERDFLRHGGRAARR
jgi:predicted RNA polymerase sigma factor